MPSRSNKRYYLTIQSIHPATFKGRGLLDCDAKPDLISVYLIYIKFLSPRIFEVSYKELSFITDISYTMIQDFYSLKQPIGTTKTPSGRLYAYSPKPQITHNTVGDCLLFN